MCQKSFCGSEELEAMYQELFQDTSGPQTLSNDTEPLRSITRSSVKSNRSITTKQKNIKGCFKDKVAKGGSQHKTGKQRSKPGKGGKKRASETKDSRSMPGYQ
jgi:hypothetical protein